MDTRSADLPFHAGEELRIHDRRTDGGADWPHRIAYGVDDGNEYAWISFICFWGGNLKESRVQIVILLRNAVGYSDDLSRVE